MKAILFCVVVSFSVSSQAVQSPKGIKNPCESLLSSTKGPTPLDFVVSDLEGSYLEVIKDLDRFAKEGYPSLSEMEVLLKKKAAFLNEFESLVRSLLFSESKEEQDSINLHSLAQMVYYFGLPPKRFGLTMAPNGEVGLVSPPEKKPSSETAGIESKKEKIGFLDFGKDQEDDSLNQKFTVGFSALVPAEEDLPLRLGGRIDFQFIPKQKRLLVGDFEKLEGFSVPMNLMMINQIDSPEKSFSVVYDENLKEWLVAYTNHLNPTGRIGF
ncbi:hypothetical protein GW916_06215 [bacterium]|nr:hypothetical protein [bacterium]